MGKKTGKINALSLKQFTAFENADFNFSSGINVFIGANSTGKTHVMKIIYTMLKVIKMKIEKRLLTEYAAFKYFAETIQDVFNISGIDAFTRNNRLSQNAEICLKYENIPFRFVLSKRHSPDEFFCEDTLADTTIPASCVYIPSKEFLSINKGFIAAYNNRELPYDETYYDLALALNALPLRKEKQLKVNNSINMLENVIVGNSSEKNNIITHENGHFYFDLPEGKLDVYLVSDGFRKIGLLLYLLKNGALNDNSILFWDEPESGLNPKLIVEVVNILKEFASSGMQIFIATHDYLISHELSLLTEYPASSDVNIKFFALHKPNRKSGVIVESGHTLTEIEHNPILEEFASHYDRESFLFTKRSK